MLRYTFFSLVFLLLTGCAAPTAQATPTLTPLPFYTATLVPTLTPRPSVTPAPPTITPTFAPVSASASAQLNVRAAPNASANSLGMLEFGNAVTAVGKNAAGDWLLVIYPPGSPNTGWALRQYLQTEGDVDALPVVEAAQAVSVPVNSTPTPRAQTATLTHEINVRAGPSSAFSSLGMLAAGTVVNLTGRNQTDTWLQIAYPSAPEGVGWVAAAYASAENLQGLPYFDNEGKLLFAPTSAPNPGEVTVTPTAFSQAGADGDSESNPGVRLVFSPDGARTLTFASDLSAPTGDNADWVAFTPYLPSPEAGYIYARLDCSGNGGITAHLEKDGIPVPETTTLVCGMYDVALKVLGGQEYFIVLNADGSGGPLRYASYTLTLHNP